MLSAHDIQEQLKLDAMQRAWQGGKRMAPSSVFVEPVELEDIFTSPCQSSSVNKKSCSSPVPVTFCNDNKEEENLEILRDHVEQKLLFDVPKSAKAITLDATACNDFPATYKVYGLESHQLPVVGVYMDSRVIPGFKYRVRPLPVMNQQYSSLPYIFGEKALTLKSIGRGYARRFTFEAEENCLNNNENYFWSDNRPEGYGFELELVSNGDKFTVFDTSQEAQGTLEVLKIEGPQIEISSTVTKHGIEKRATIMFTGKVEFYETGVAKPMLFTGIAISVKRKGVPSAEIVKIINVTIKRQRYILTPGIQKNHRRFTVRGKDIGDIPTKYTMTGLEPYEIPVVGTYVDSRVIPGFYYKVRPNDRKEHLFNGRALKLCSIGMGYAKRLTFAPDSLLEPNNYLWSDNHPDGLGLEPRAVHTGMKFSITADGQPLGEASVFRADMPQMEERMEKLKTASGKYAIIKYIHIDVMCHVKLARTGGGSADNEEHLMRVYGLAVVRKEPNSNDSHIVCVENVGLDSQLNVLFAQTHTELTFHPLK